MVSKRIECTITRLRVIRDDGQLTEELRTRLDGAIEELTLVATTCRDEADAKRWKQAVLSILGRVGWWWLLRELGRLDESDSQD